MAAWLPESVIGEERQHLIGWAALAAVLAALALWSYFQVFIAPDYGTDEIAFDQYAASLALHAINPYLHSMAPAFPLFHVSPNGYTFQLNGEPITALSYPALSFEAYIPLLALGLATQAAVWVNVGAWALGAVILYAVLPRNLAPLAVVIASADVFISYAAGGVTDALFVPLLVGAAVAWDRFGVQRGPAAWRGPVLMGLAMAVKQTPWLIVPFVVGGIVLESRQADGWARAFRHAARYTGIALAAFLAPNLPYLVGAPGAWLRGVLTPLSRARRPGGPGPGQSQPLAVGRRRVAAAAFNVAAAVVLLAAFACYLVTYPVLKQAAFLIPSIALFFAARSFGSYLVMLLPAAVAAAATTGRPAGGCRWRHWRWVALAGAAASGAAAVVAVTTPSPLAMSIQSVHTTGQLATVDQVTLAVVNRTGHRVRPAFTVEDGTSMSAFWRRQQGPALLGPYQRASYTVAPSYFAMPSIGNGFQVLAFAEGQASVSRTSSLPGQWVAPGSPARHDRRVGRGGPADHGACRDREPAGPADAGRPASRCTWARSSTRSVACSTARPSSTRGCRARLRWRRSPTQRAWRPSPSIRRWPTATGSTSRPIWSTRPSSIRTATRRSSPSSSSHERGGLRDSGVPAAVAGRRRQAVSVGGDPASRVCPPRASTRRFLGLEHHRVPALRALDGFYPVRPGLVRDRARPPEPH